jgi:hypothetical protein
MSKQRRPVGPRPAGDASKLPLVDYLLLSWIGALLQKVGMRKSSHFTLLHRKVAKHASLKCDDLSIALLVALRIWCAVGAVSSVLAVALALVARVFEGLHLNAATLDVVFVLFIPVALSIPLSLLSLVRLQSLNVSGRIRRPVSDDVKVSRYRPKQWDFWVAIAFTVSFLVLISL